jgi:dimethylargininase
MFAFVRAVSPRLAACALTHLARAPIDVARAAAQHAAYRGALADAGCMVFDLPPLPDAPDAVFVEDTALLLDGHAIITRPAATSRAVETPSVAATVAAHFIVHELPAGRLEGGDVLRIGRRLFVGATTRTDEAGIGALRACTASLGFNVRKVAVGACLHLKTGVTYLGADGNARETLLLNPGWIDAGVFADLGKLAVLPVDAAEPWAANTLRVHDTLLLPAGNPRTQARLLELGFKVCVVDISELQKAEAGLTCMSLLGEPATAV